MRFRQRRPSSGNAFASTPTLQTYSLTGFGAWTHGLTLINTGSGTTLKFQQVKLIGDTLLFDEQTVQYDYDAVARLKQTRHYAGANTGNPPVQQYTYAYDTAYNRTQQVVNGVTTNYSFNAANRLTSDGTNTYTYDNAGRMTSDGVNTHTWDRDGRLLSMGTTSYLYDGMGRRVQQTVGANVTKYLLDVQSPLWVVLNEAVGANTTKYIHDHYGLQRVQNPAGNWRWVVQDSLHSIRSTVDSSGTPQESRRYSPYGEATQISGSSQTSFGFAGQATDNNGLTYLRARYMKPSIGRFVSLDVMEDINRYAYAMDNPVNLVDLDGRAAALPERSKSTGTTGTKDSHSQQITTPTTSSSRQQQQPVSTGSQLRGGSSTSNSAPRQSSNAISTGSSRENVVASTSSRGLAARMGKNIISRTVIGDLEHRISDNRSNTRLRQNSLSCGSVTFTIWIGLCNSNGCDPYPMSTTIPIPCPSFFEDLFDALRGLVVLASELEKDKAIPVPSTKGKKVDPDCDPSVLAALEATKTAICKGYSCSDDKEKLGRQKEKLLTCAELLANIAAARACLAIRQRIQDECFYKKGTDTGHDTQIKEVTESLNQCLEKAAARGCS